MTRKYVSVSEVAARMGVSVNTVWRWARERPDFPRPVRIGPSTTRWHIDELEAFERAAEEEAS